MLLQRAAFDRLDVGRIAISRPVRAAVADQLRAIALAVGHRTDVELDGVVLRQIVGSDATIADREVAEPMVEDAHELLGLVRRGRRR